MTLDVDSRKGRLTRQSEPRRVFSLDGTFAKAASVTDGARRRSRVKSGRNTLSVNATSSSGGKIQRVLLPPQQDPARFWRWQCTADEAPELL